jgi:hypothetical protein
MLREKRVVVGAGGCWRIDRACGWDLLSCRWLALNDLRVGGEDRGEGLGAEREDRRGPVVMYILRQ